MHQPINKPINVRRGEGGEGGLGGPLWSPVVPSSFLCTLEDCCPSCSPMTPFVIRSLDPACEITSPTGSHKGPIPASTSSPAPTIHLLGGPIRYIVGARAAGMRMGGPLWSPV